MSIVSTLIMGDDGTAMDPATGLTWMIPLVGQRWNGSAPEGSAASLSWDDASSQFGLGRLIAATTHDCHWGLEEKELKGRTAYHREYPLSLESYDEYSFGKRWVSFAGFRDWRLPVVEELWSLAQAGLIAPPFRKSQTWAATPSTKGVLATVAMTIRAAWLFSDNDRLARGDLPRTSLGAIRLVRGGRLFQMCPIVSTAD